MSSGLAAALRRARAGERVRLDQALSYELRRLLPADLGDRRPDLLHDLEEAVRGYGLAELNAGEAAEVLRQCGER